MQCEEAIKIVQAPILKYLDQKEPKHEGPFKYVVQIMNDLDVMAKQLRGEK